MNALTPGTRSQVVNYDHTQSGVLNVSAFCKLIKVSRSGFCKIRDRARSESAAALRPRSRAPKQPARKFDTQVVNELLLTRSMCSLPISERESVAIGSCARGLEIGCV